MRHGQLSWLMEIIKCWLWGHGFSCSQLAWLFYLVRYRCLKRIPLSQIEERNDFIQAQLNFKKFKPTDFLVLVFFISISVFILFLLFWFLLPAFIFFLWNVFAFRQFFNQFTFASFLFFFVVMFLIMFPLDGGTQLYRALMFFSARCSVCLKVWFPDFFQKKIPEAVCALCIFL